MRWVVLVLALLCQGCEMQAYEWVRVQRLGTSPRCEEPLPVVPCEPGRYIGRLGELGVFTCGPAQ